MVGFDRTPVSDKRGGGKKKRQGRKRGRRKPSPKRRTSKKRGTPTPSASSSPARPTPTPDFTVNCFGPGAFFLGTTQAGAPGPIGAAVGVTGRAPNEGDVPNVASLDGPRTAPLPGVNRDNYQGYLDGLKKARDLMADSALYHNRLGNQDQVIECFESFCKKQGWPV
jgi:hypothetical protein